LILLMPLWNKLWNEKRSKIWIEIKHKHCWLSVLFVHFYIILDLPKSYITSLFILKLDILYLYWRKLLTKSCFQVTSRKCKIR
jgi:hypothetical protein